MTRFGFVFIIIVAVGSKFAAEVLCTAPRSHPYLLQVLARNRNGIEACGAILLGPVVALTRASCVSYTSRWEIKVIRPDHTNGEGMVAQSSHAKHIIFLDSLEGLPGRYDDIALVVLSEAFHTSAKEIPLVPTTPIPLSGKALVMGWLFRDNAERWPEGLGFEEIVVPIELPGNGSTGESTGQEWFCVQPFEDVTYPSDWGWFVLCGENHSETLCGVAMSGPLKCNRSFQLTSVTIFNHSPWIQAEIDKLILVQSSGGENASNAEALPLGCTSEHFKCTHTGKCLQNSQVCDNFYDCEDKGRMDKSDEENCKSNSGCHWSQFPCILGNECITSDRRCDGMGDCADNSDELNCSASVTSPNCGEIQFQCHISKICLPQYYVCNDEFDCGKADKSDEENCREVNGCHRLQFGCHTGNNCISGIKRCDGVSDCADDSDELNCSFQSGVRDCSSWEFQCEHTKKCVQTDSVCDGINDCGGTDRSDEKNCRANNGCHTVQFPCSQGNECISRHKVCDHEPDCFDGSDEENCESLCGRTVITCRISKECYSSGLICNGVNNCGAADNSDEEHCLPGLNGCAWTQFACREDETCIEGARKCDGYTDCSDGSDEENCQGPTKCHWMSYDCGSGQKCIPGEYRCDDYKLGHCPDSSDEKDCDRYEAPCHWAEFPCRNNSACLPGYQKCDGRIDCEDASDEDNCVHQNVTNCLASTLVCKSSRKCFSLADICNGHKDCGEGDFSDEEACLVGVNGCQWNQFACQDEGKCVPGHTKCDGENQCKDGSDEVGCADGSGCHWTQFVCQSDSKCIPGNLKCDGIRNCLDGSDEEDCGVGNCHWIEFGCHDNSSCIPGHEKCDGKMQCTDGSDERDCDDRTAPIAWQIITYVTIPTAIVAILTVLLFVLLRRYRNQTIRLTALEMRMFERGDEKLLRIDKYAHENAQLVPYNRAYEINWNDFKIDEEGLLGEGAFGVVFMGQLLHSGDTIAVKTVKPNVDKSILLALLSEIKVMIYLDKHENILELKGACTEFWREGRIYILVEYCPLGSLESYLRKLATNEESVVGGSSDITNSSGSEIEINFNLKDSLTWAIQIARGMQHLQSKRVIHGDLAARNILLFSKRHVKITDFGLSRQLNNYDVYVKPLQDKLPWRWLALETLKSNEFSLKSDVWSYGITLWEIFSLGLIPYPGLYWTADIVEYLEENNRLSKPQYASEDIYRAMLHCWEREPESRPAFCQLQQMFQSYAQQVFYRNSGEYYAQMPEQGTTLNVDEEGS